MKRILHSALLLMLCLITPLSVSAYSPTSDEVEPASEVYWSNISSQFVMSEAPMTNNQVQVFDVAKGKVVKSMDSTADIQKTAAGWLSKIKQLAPEVHPDMKSTYIVRIPVDPPKSLTVGSVTLPVKEIFTFYYEDTSKEPLLLIFDENKKPFFFHIQEDLTPFIQSLSIPN